MDKRIIQEYMKKANPWWDENFKTLNLDYKSRDVYKEIARHLPIRLIIALTGLRRVGKTTIMTRLIVQKIAEGFDKRHILYFSFDEFSEERIMDLLDIYGEIFGKLDRSAKYVIVLDEIQRVKNWSEQLKAAYDLYPNIKLIISGSESLFIREKSRESLAGRIFEFKVNPLTFKEFLSFKGAKIDNLFLQREEILKNLRQFLLTNGFPEIIDYNEDDARKYIREGIIDKVIYSDSVQVFEVKDPALMKSIFDVIYNDPGQMIEIQGLAKELGISRRILSNYLGYLEEAFLIKKLYNFSKNARKTQRRLKRFYSTMINPLLLDSSFPKLFEQFVAIQLNAEFFWRDVFKNEVDIVKIDPLTAIEVKAGEVREKDLESLKKFISKFKPKDAFVLSYDLEKVVGGIKVIPFYKYLLK